MELDVGSNTVPCARSEDTVMEVTVDESSLTKTLSHVSCSGLVTEMTTAELAPLQSVKTHGVTTIEVTKDSTNVDMDETLSNAAYPVYVKSLTEAEDVLHRFENDTKTRYSVWRCPKDFGNSQIDITNKRIYWQEFDIGDKITVKSDGVPFIMMGRKVYDCHFGKDRNIKLKERMRLQREEVSKSDAAKARKTPLTKKIDCPAKIVFCEIIYFPDFKISNNTKYHRGVIAKKIKESFAAGSVNLGNIERRIYISFPTSDEHSGHPSSVQGTNLSHRVDPKISKKLSELVLSGVRNENEMREQLEMYITHELYPGKAKPFHSNKRYFPNMSIIRIKMYNKYILQRLVVLDCDQIEELVEQVKIDNPDDKIFTRRFEGMNEVLAQGTFSLSHEELLEDELRVRQKFSQQQMMFVHQTSFQRHLLKRYGNHVCFLDPVYRTVKYPLPLFFVMVKTNVDYQVAAMFVVQDENKESTKEALELIKSWNPDWKPKVFMVDNDPEEFACVEECFPDSQVLLSDFHREQSWQHWLSQSCNGVVAHKNAILIYLRRIADAKTEQEFEEALELLEKTDFWQCDYGEMFREWFRDKWLRMKEGWVYAKQKTFLSDIVMTNFTVEHQKFTHKELLNQEGTVLSDVLKRIIKIILPAKRDFYMEQNVPNSSEELCNIPSFYRVRPRDLAEHTAKCMACVNEFTSDHIFVKSLARGEFFVKSSHSDNKYKVHFGNDMELPHCECEDWFKTMMPCKHFLVVMQYFKYWNWSSFPENYRNSPYLTLDPIIDQNFTNEDPIATRSDPSSSQQDTSQIQTNPSASRLDKCSNQQDLRESQPVPSVSLTEVDDANVIPAVSLYDVLPDKKSGLKSAANECRDLLSDLNNMTYMIQEKKVLTILQSRLREALENLKLSAVEDDVAFGSYSEAKKSEGKKNEVYPLKGRKREGDWRDLGSGASKSSKMDENETSSKTEIPEQVLQSASDHYEAMNGNADTTCEVANSNIETSGDTSGRMNGYRDIYDGTNSDAMPSGDVNDVRISLKTSDENSNTGAAVITRDTNGDVTASENTHDPHGFTENLNDPLQLNTSQSSESQNGTRLNCLEFEDKKVDDVTVFYSNPVGSLSKYEEKLLMKQEAVTHSIINLAQGLLQEAFPQMGGLQSVARGPIQAFQHVSGDFIQILHDGYTHWVCTSNKILDVRERAALNMYDSMNQGFIAKFTKQQLASFMCVQSAEMKVIVKSVQQHSSPVDCGVFAIAFATALAFAQDPSKLRFDVPKMRPHLVQCLKLKKMSPFPEIKPGLGSDIVLSKRKFYTVELFCSCRMPYEKPKSEADLMAQCSVCDEWFHQKCDSLKTSGHKFVCRLCARKV